MPSKTEIQKVLEDDLSSSEKDQLIEELLNDSQLGAEMLDQHCMDMALRALYDPHNRSLEKAVMTCINGSSDERVSKRAMSAIKREKRPKKTTIYRWMMPIAAAACIVLGVGAVLHSIRLAKPVAFLVTSINAEWEKGDVPSHKGLLPGKRKLLSGLVEFRTTEGAVITVQSPAEFTLQSASFMDLQRGVIKAHVPKQASGFTVKTRDARIVDIGTRFGVSAAPSRPTETHVFEGHVQVDAARHFDESMLDLYAGEAFVLDSFNASTRRIPAQLSRFPQPSIVEADLLKSDGWSLDGPAHIDGPPRKFGIWGGDHSEIISEWRNVKPHHGESMLRMISGSLPGGAGVYTSHEQWQFVNLRPYAEEIKKGGVVADASMWIRQVGGEPVSFRLLVAGFNLEETPGPQLAVLEHPGINAMAVGQAMSDPQAGEWREVSARLELPKNTRFVYVNPRAQIGPDKGIGTIAEVGYFIDSVKFKLTIPLRPSTDN